MNGRDYEFDFVSLITNNPKYIDKCIVKSYMLNSPYNRYFDVVKENYQKSGIVDAVRLEEEFGELYQECIYNGVAIDINDAFQSYQRKVLSEYKDKQINELVHRWSLKLIDSEMFVNNINQIENMSISDIRDLTAEDIMNSLTRKDKRLNFSKFLVLLDTLKIEQHDLMTIAGGTGSGKSSMALNFMEDLSLKYPCLYFNMEMSEDQLNERLIAIHAKENLKDLDRFTEMDESFKNEIEFRANNLTRDRHIKIVTGSQNIDNITSIIASHDQERHFIVFVDHVGLIHVQGARTANERITAVYQTLRKLSLDYNCTIISLCQLNRESVKQDPRPTLSALKDSSEAEQSSSKVCFIYEKENQYYFETAKNRNGEIGRLKMNYNKQKQIMEIFSSKKDVRE